MSEEPTTQSEPIVVQPAPVVIKHPKPPRTWYRTKGTVLASVVLGAFSGPAIWLFNNSDFVDWEIAFHASRSHIAREGQPTVQDMVRSQLPQYMQTQPLPEPQPSDFLQGAANALPAHVRSKMAGVFRGAINLIGQDRIRELEPGLNDYFRTNLSSVLGSDYDLGNQFMRVWERVGNGLNASGQLGNMSMVSQYLEGTEQILRGN